MDWWQQNQAYVIVGLAAVAVIGLMLLRGAGRRARNRMVDSALTNTRPDNKYLDKLEQSIATTVVFPVDRQSAISLLNGMKLPRWWKPGDPGEWIIPRTNVEGSYSGTIAIVETIDGGSRLALTRASDSLRIPISEPDWRRLRKASIAAAAAGGVTAHEALGVPLVRVPTVDVTGMAPLQVANAPHQWERPANGAT